MQLEPGRSGMIFKNSTALNEPALAGMFLDVVHNWPTKGLEIRVRYSRGSDFSGTCCYSTNRIYVNIGKHLRYPYLMDTYLARAVTSRAAWWKPLYSIELADGCQVVLFVLLHEYYHWLIKRARRNTRQKESMCDRFAARALVDLHGAVIRDSQGKSVAREVWDFQDLDRFVAPALTRRAPRRRPEPAAAKQPIPPAPSGQLLLFSM